MRWITFALTAALLVTVPTPARADRVDMITGRRELIEALAKRDVATIQARASFPLRVRHMWFDTAACKKFSGNQVEVAADQVAALVGCIADLGVQLIDDHAFIAATYGPGAMLVLGITPDGKQLTWLSSFDTVDGKPLIHPDVFAQHVATFQREVAPDAALKKIVDDSSGLHVQAEVTVCTDATGTRAKNDYAANAVMKGDAADSESTPVPSYGKLIDKAIPRWKLAPFRAHGKPVRACAIVTLGYPGHLLPAMLPEPANNPYGMPSTGLAPPTPPSSDPPAPPQNVSPAVLESNRISGEKNITPDDATKTEMQRANQPRVIGAFKLCVDTAGKVVEVQALKSTGFAAYDRKLEAGIWKWAYKPYVVDGKPVRVCTAVTFIYAQVAAPAPKR